MRGTLLFVAILTILSCSTPTNKETNQIVQGVVDSSSQDKTHTNTYRQLACGLFINKSGDIAFKASDNSYKMDTTGNSKPFDVYLTAVWNARPYDTVFESRDELKNVVDTASLEILSWEHFKDKKNVYHFTPMADGGSITIMDYADPKTFKVLESYLYAVDKSFCYYRGERIKGADRKTFRIVDTTLAFHFAMDKHNYYDGDLRMTKEDIKRNGLDFK